MPLTCDAFLGGQLSLWQPRDGYRAGIEPVLLAAAVPARAGQSVLDLGCGVGTALFCLGVRVPGLSLTGVELQEGYAALARQNAADNGIDAHVLTGDVQKLPPGVGDRQFDHVITNPPFFDDTGRTPAASRAREQGRGGTVGLGPWLDAAVRRLGPRGRLTLVHRAGRLDSLLAAMSGRLGDIHVLPVAGRAGRAARHVILSGTRDRRTALTLLPPLVLHDGPRHVRDGDSFTAEAQRILRGAAGITVMIEKNAG